MDPERTRIEEDLRGIVAGEVLCDDARRALYATDGSLFEIWPLAVVRPRSVEDVAATVAWAAERGIPVHPRGSGTSICGSPLGPGIVIDCGRFLRRIILTDPEAGTVRVQAGVIAERLERHLGRFGRMFGPDPANRPVTTIGGMIGRNASGSRFPRHGAVRGRIAAVQAVCADGSIVEVTPTAPVALPEAAEAPRLPMLAARLAAILDESADTIARLQPPSRASHGGYGLHDLRVAGTDAIHLPRLFCGAEGTLGIVTEATLLTVPADRATAVGLLMFDSLERAAEAAVRVGSLAPSACDVFDKRHLALARSTSPAFDVLIPPVAEAALLVEFTADEQRQASAALDDALAAGRRAHRGCIDIRRAEDPHDAAFFWELSRTAVATIAEVRAVVRPVPFIEDIVVPPPAAPDFLRRLQEVLRDEDFTAMTFGHLAHGQLHVRPHVDPRDPGARPRLEALAEAVYAEVVACGGTIGGELGLGLSRGPFFARLFPELTAVFTEIKRLFDPAGILNPGWVAAARDPTVEPDEFVADLLATPVEFRRPLAAATTGRESDGVTAARDLPVLGWSVERVAAEVDACNGCGGCRSHSTGERMCPRFRENPAEEAAPRAKANALAALLAGTLDPRAITASTAQSITDTCFNCHQCRFDCSAGVDIPALVLELKATQLATTGLPLDRWLLSRIDAVSAWGGAVRPLANWAIGNPQARWVIEKTLGIARGRKLPPFTGSQLMRWAARRGLTRPSRRSGPRVLLFLDTYARRHDPLLVQAFIAVLERNGIGVFIDPRQVAAGMPLVAEGDIDAARRHARINMKILAEAVRLGHRIVCTEPAAVTCIRHDYPLLVDDEEMGRVTDATCDAMTFLWELHREGRLRLDFRPVPTEVLHHAPCHTRTGSGLTPAEHLLRLVPGLVVRPADRGCSGMAGTFGLARRNYRASLRMGLGLVSALRGSVAAGVTECSACRLQMEQGTTKPTIHPVKLLAKAYGLLDGPRPHGLDDLLTTPSGRLTTS
jgi:FAD/FMN-containing dehydrogenase/Fe-S oxidoreductase